MMFVWMFKQTIAVARTSAVIANHLVFAPQDVWLSLIPLFR